MDGEIRVEFLFVDGNVGLKEMDMTKFLALVTFTPPC